MSRNRRIPFGVSLDFAIAVPAATHQAAREASARRTTEDAPIFEVDPLWPEPLPNDRMRSSNVGVGADSCDHGSAAADAWTRRS
jgi:hypothetical protein